MAIKSITEGMTAEQVSGLLDGNFAEVQKGVNEAKGAVGTEELRAKAAEEANAEAIGAEVERAEAAEAAEAERAQEAERELDGRITEVQQGSNAAIEALAQYAGEIDGNVAAEKERAQAAEMENRQKIEAEVTRAKGAEEANAEAIADEVARAKEAEASLTEDVGVISGDLEKEIQRAQEAEQALGTEITEAENRVDERVTEVRDSLEAEVQARSAAVADLNANTGINEYPAFDPAVDYAVGDVVNYEGRLRRFVAEHAAGEWNAEQVEEWSERKEREEVVADYTLIYTGNRITPTRTENGKYISISGVELENSSYTLMVWDIASKNEYAITARIAGASTALAVYKDENGNLLGYEERAESKSKIFGNKKLKLPYGTKTIYLSTQYPSNAKLIQITGNTAVKSAVTVLTNTVIDGYSNINNYVKELYIANPNNEILPTLYIKNLRKKSSNGTGIIITDADGSYYLSYGVVDESYKKAVIELVTMVENSGIKGYAVIDFENMEDGEVTGSSSMPIIEERVNNRQSNPTISSYIEAKAIKEETQMNIDSLSENIDDIREAITYTDIVNIISPVEEVQGEYYKYRDGSVGVGDTYKRYLYEIEEGKNYAITCKSAGSITGGVVYFDENKEYLGYEYRNLESGVTYELTDVVLHIPAGTRYVGSTSVYTYNNARLAETIDVSLKEKITPIEADIKAIKEKANISILTDKVLAACGDSITHAVQGGDIDIDDNFNPISGYKKKSYMYYIAKANNAKWHNYGISGSTLGDCYAIGASRNGFSAENGRYTQMADDLDYIVLMFGTNDADYGRWMLMEQYIQEKYGEYHKFPAKGNSIGDAGVMTQEEYDDVMSVSGVIDGETLKGNQYWRAKYIGNIDDNTNKTWLGAWNIVLEYLILKYPKAKILVWLNPTNTVFDESTKAVCKKWGIPYLDMRSDNIPTIWAKNEWDNLYIQGVKMDSYSDGRNITRKDVFTADGLHPNADGYMYIYPIIEAKMKSI